MWPWPFRDVWMKAGRSRVAARCFMLWGFLKGGGCRGKDAPCCVGGVCGGGIDHKLNFSFQFDQP